MNNEIFVYVIYIATTPEKVWQALLDGELTRQYWQHETVSDWQPGSPWQLVADDGKRTVHVVGEVVETIPNTRLAMTWADLGDKGNQAKHSKVAIDIETVGEMVRLTVTHTDLGLDMQRRITNGWPMVLSSLKSFLETGRALDIGALPPGCDSNIQINPGKTKQQKTLKRDALDFTQRVKFRAPCVRVYDAIATLAGLRGWWTTRVSGSTATDGELRFEFEGLDEYIVMRVNAAHPPLSVRWTCVNHTALGEWNGTTMSFDLADGPLQTCEMNFRHTGLTARLECYDDCKQGWQHFLASLTAYVETGEGTPFGA